jgi:hypothetical protein
MSCGSSPEWFDGRHLMIERILVRTFGTLGAVWGRLRRGAAAVNGAGGGLTLDVGLYALSAIFALVTATSSTLVPHRAWGAVAAVGYASAALVALAQRLIRTLCEEGHPLVSRVRGGCPSLHGTRARAVVAAGAWTATALLPLVLLAYQRATGRTDRAQEEVLVIEDGGRRLLETGTPYLGRAAIAALPESERLEAYLPYQPGMAGFGIPRALDGAGSWWSDARVGFAVVTVAGLAAAVLMLRRAGAPLPVLVRAVQVAIVLPLGALTLATGGDDLPVLALCLLALAFAATGRLGAAGLSVGTAAALKLFAWPVALVLAAHAVTRGRPALARFAAGALAPPLLTALPTLVADPGAMVENVLAYPMGRGLVSSPAQSPLPGHLIATYVPGGRTIAAGLLLLTGLAFAAVLVRRPPRTAAGASLTSGYGLLAAVLLLPATRFGYLLYPVAFLVWAAALPDGRTPARVRTAKSARSDGH